MKYKILSLLCVLCLLAGCRIELPPQSASSSLQEPASSLSESLPQSVNSSAPSSQNPVPSSAVSSAAAAKAAASGAASKPASSKVTAPKTPVASKSYTASAEQPKEQNCTLFISCSEILKHKDKFSADRLAVVPTDGLIYEESGIPFEDGETVFDVLLRVTKANNIQMDQVASPVYQTNYIKAIDNIYEKDFGSGSGWMYAVNGKQPPVGCSSYKLKSGDKIQWMYVCGQ